MTSHEAFAKVAMESRLMRTAQVDAGDPDALGKLSVELGGTAFALVMLFASPSADVASLPARAAEVFGDTPVVGCTTAGEISSNGYSENSIVAVGLPAGLFMADLIRIPDLSSLHAETLIGSLIRSRQWLARQRPDWTDEFAFLMVDGLSTREDQLVSALSSGLGPVPMFGGSAGDGTRFAKTQIFYDGQPKSNAAVLCFVRTACPVQVFSLDHLVPTDQRMVVTSADPARRIVHQINAEPAAFEYARILGKDPAQLDTFTFAAHPVVVRFGGRHHVRSIQQMAPNGDLVFFSAIDEGLVLTLAEPLDMVEHLSSQLADLGRNGAPDTILACDCILRKIEAQEKQMTGQISALLRKHRVVGLSTYGEQLGAMHVNQTMTGVAIYPPRGGTG